MNDDKIVENKSKKFAIRIINLYKHLMKQKKEFILARQILKSGTSIGANLAEAQYAISKKDFFAKVYISFKECAETKYWLELLYETDFLTKDEFESMMKDCEELLKLLTTITKTMKTRLKSTEKVNNE